MVTPSFQVFLIGSFDCVAFVKQKKRLLLFVELYNNILLPSRGGVLFFILVVYSSSSVLTFTINMATAPEYNGNRYCVRSSVLLPYSIYI
jgi:hypothetical protein